MGGRAVDRQPLLARAAKNVPAAHDQRHLDAHIVHALHFTRDALNGIRVNPEGVRPRKRFAR